MRRENAVASMPLDALVRAGRIAAAVTARHRRPVPPWVLDRS